MLNLSPAFVVKGLFNKKNVVGACNIGKGGLLLKSRYYQSLTHTT